MNWLALAVDCVFSIKPLTDHSETANFHFIPFCLCVCSGFEQINYGLFSFPLWVCTIVFLSLSIVMGLVTIGFSVFNVFGRPIETITGPMGLYLWNGLSCECTPVSSLSVTSGSQ